MLGLPGMFEPYESLELPVAWYNHDPAMAAFTVPLAKEIEDRRVELGGIRGGRHGGGLLTVDEPKGKRKRGGLLGGAYVKLDPTPGDYANGRRWYHFLTDNELITKARQRLGVTSIQFLSMCIDKLSPPNWETLFWMRAYLETTSNQALLASQFAALEKFAGKRARSATARSGAIAKLAVDLTQEAKVFVKQCWDDWQRKPDRYRTKAAFARDMLAKCEALRSQAVIERWCRHWGKVRTQQAG